MCECMARTGEDLFYEKQQEISNYFNLLFLYVSSAF